MNQSKYIFLIFIIISIFILVRFAFQVSADFSRIFTYKSNLETIRKKLHISKNYPLTEIKPQRSSDFVGKEHSLLSKIISTAQTMPALKIKSVDISRKQENSLLDLTIETDYESIFDFCDRVSALKCLLQINSLCLTNISRDSNEVIVNIKLKVLSGSYT